MYLKHCYPVCNSHTLVFVYSTWLGSTYTASELKELASVLKRYDVLVLSDEIYASVTFSGVHASLASFYPEGTIVTEGISKWCGAGGWRLGSISVLVVICCNPA